MGKREHVLVITSNEGPNMDHVTKKYFTYEATLLHVLNLKDS